MRKESSVHLADQELSETFKLLLETIWVLCCSGVIAIVVLHYIVAPGQIYGISMDPTFYDGQEFVYAPYAPIKRGDVIILAHNGHKITKRVLADEGDQVAITNGELQIFTDDTRELFRIQLGTNDTLPLLTVPEGNYWLLGDNINFSNDSRKNGSFPEEEVVGVILGTVWPLEDFGPVAPPPYDIEVTDYSVLPTAEEIERNKALQLVKP